MQVSYSKLVRDRIPEIIKAEGSEPVTRVLDQASFRTALLAKLVEEAQEAGAAAPADLPGELADVLEVLRALLTELDMTWEELAGLADRKSGERGGFQRRIFLERVESG